MDRVDLTHEALAALQPSTRAPSKAINHDEARSIRGRLLGVLIRKRRLDAKRSLADCADFMGAETGLVEGWEYGADAPSLPQLELLAQFLSGRYPDARAASDEDRAAQEEYMLLRQRLIGALLRAARQSSGLPIDAVSEAACMEAQRLTRFELGEEMIPLSDLTALAQALQLDLRTFAASPKPLAGRARPEGAQDKVAEIGGDWRSFASESENLPFIRLAMAFQHIARDDLHRIADALFAIIRANGDANGWSGSST